MMQWREQRNQQAINVPWVDPSDLIARASFLKRLYFRSPCIKRLYHRTDADLTYAPPRLEGY